jgi:hypothetical protein
MDKSPKQPKFLYKILYLLMDLESLMWDIADFIIKPVAKCRGFVTRRIAKKLGLVSEIQANAIAKGRKMLAADEEMSEMRREGIKKRTLGFVIKENIQ